MKFSYTTTAVLALLGAAASRAQNSAPGPEDATFSTNVKVVNVLATVRDKRGMLRNDLARDDFSILENGHPQDVKYFSRESDLPLTVGLLVDTSMSQEHVVQDERGASFRFLDQVLRRRDDRVFIEQFDMAVMPRVGLTSSRLELDEALSLVDTPSRRDLKMQTGGGTLLYDAIVQACRETMAGQKGRKAVVVLTDGVDEGSQATLKDAIEAAQRTETMIYAILFAEPGWYGMSALGRLGEANGRSVLSQMARDTGGGYFEVSRRITIAAVFARIEEELRSEYSLGFVSDAPVTISGFRKLQVAVKEKGLSVQARDRYWAAR